jgi:hypothetical protein
VITKEAFIIWKSDPVTKLVFAQIADLIEQGKDELSYRAGSDSLWDREVVGRLNGFRAVLEIQPDEEEVKDVD